MIPLWIRVLHWVIAFLFLLLIVTGITQHFSTAQFSIIDYSFATTIHELSGIILSTVYVLFIAGIFITGYWRKYLPAGRKSRWLVWQKNRFHGRNPVIIFLILPLIIVTGLIYWYPDYAPEEVLGFDGLWTIAISHYIVSTLGTAYTIGHIFMAFLSGMMRKIIYGRMGSARMKID